MAGGESKDLRKPLVVTKSRVLSNLRSVPSRKGPKTSSNNTNLKGLISFILPNVSNGTSFWGWKVAVSPSRTIMSSENTGDVMVENASATVR